jgi:biopolymer transport protein ExbB
VGLISAFTAVGNANPAEKAALLSGAISVAMNTTAFGLVAAIPLMVLHAMLQNKMGAIVTSIQMSAVKFLNIMTLYRFVEAGNPRPADLSVPSLAAGAPAAASTTNTVSTGSALSQA